MPRPSDTDLPKVLFLDQSGEIGGAQLSLIDIVQHYPGTARVYLLDHGPYHAKLQNLGIATKVVPGVLQVRRASGLFSALTALPKLLNLTIAIAFEAHAFDLIYANTMKAIIVASLGKPIHRKPIIWHVRDLLTAEHFSATMRLAVRLAANSAADTIIANSRATASAYVSNGGRHQPVVIYNPISPSPIEPSVHPLTRTALALAHHLNPAQPIIGCFGRLAAWKGQHIFISALAANPRWQAVIVGAPLFGEEAYYRELQSLVRRLRLHNRVRFLGFREPIIPLMACVDLVVHTSISAEPFGRVVVEAMLSGTPLIATDAGGVPELVTSGETGLLVPPGNTNALVSAITQQLSQPSARTMALLAQRVASERFAHQNCLPKINQQIAHTAKVTVKRRFFSRAIRPRSH